MQAIEFDGHGVVRFRGNAIVRYLLDEASAGRRCDLNDIARHGGFSRVDWEQFDQLIGYSVSGAPHQSPAAWREANVATEVLIEKRRKQKKALR